MMAALERRGTVAAAWTSGRGVAGVVREVRGTDAELVEVEAGADPARGGPSASRRSRGKEDSTRGGDSTWHSGPWFGAASLEDIEGQHGDEGVVRGKQLWGHDARAAAERWEKSA
jgi:hypothetical protein